VTIFNLACIVFAQVVLLLAAAAQSMAAEQSIDMRDPAQVIHAYLRATYARDFIEAYRFISFKDRQFRDLNRYVQQRGAFSGFTLVVGRKVSESIQISVVKKEESGNHARVEIRYSVPDPSKIATLVLNWDVFRLNALPNGERSEILTALEKRKDDGAIEMREGKEKFELVKEGDEWRVFLNWAAGVSVPLRLDLSKALELDVRLSRNEVFVQPGDFFDISLKIKNPTARAITVRIGHLIEPLDVADYLDVVQCGFLLPLTIAPGKEQEYGGTYMLRGSIPEGVHQVTLQYDFNVLK
jgi:Cytochrome c oxidase assembly protein CtaG/Cox11